MTIDPQFYHISLNLSALDDAMGFPPDGDTSSTIDFLFTCNKTKSNSIPPGGLSPFDFPLVQNVGGTFSWNEEVEHPFECERRFKEFKEFMSENAKPEVFENKITRIIYPQYQNNINELSANAHSDFYSDFRLNDCFNNKDQMIALDNLYFNMLQLGKSISESSSYDEAYNYAKEMLSLYKEKEQYAGNEFDLYDKFMGPCRQVGNGALVYGQEIAKINVQFEKIVDQRNIALAQFNSVVNQLNHIEFILLDLNKTMEECDRYFDPMENMTKQELFHAFNGPTFRSNFDDLQYFARFLKVAIKNYVHHMNRIKEGIINIFKNIFALEFPTLHGYNIHNLKIVRNTFEIYETEAMLIAEGLNANIRTSMPRLWNLTINRLIDPIENIDIFEDIDDISFKLKAFVKDLTDYDKSLEVSSAFLK